MSKATKTQAKEAYENGIWKAEKREKRGSDGKADHSKTKMVVCGRGISVDASEIIICELNGDQPTPDGYINPCTWTFAEAEQHARLIASAPEMLEMLKLIVQRGMEQPSTAGAVLTLTHQDWLLAKSIVAKTEGSAEK